MATIHIEEFPIPFGIPPRDDGRIEVIEEFLSLKFRFLAQSIYLEEKVFDELGTLLYTTI